MACSMGEGVSQAHACRPAATSAIRRSAPRVPSIEIDRPRIASVGRALAEVADGVAVERVPGEAVGRVRIEDHAAALEIAGQGQEGARRIDVGLVPLTIDSTEQADAAALDARWILVVLLDQTAVAFLRDLVAPKGQVPLMV